MDNLTEKEQKRAKLKVIQGDKKEQEILEIANISEYKPFHPSRKRKLVNVGSNIVVFKKPTKRKK